MKKIIILLLLIIGMLFLASCGQDVESEMSKLEELRSQYDVVGLQHNIELDQMLSTYRMQSDIADRSACEKLADDHFTNSGSVASRIMKVIDRSGQLSKPMSNSEVVDELADSIEIYAEYPAIFESISNILDANLDIDHKIEKLEEIYLLIDEKAKNNADRETLMNGLSTTIHSALYWHENYDEWQDVLNPSMAKASLGIVGAIGIIDGAGAVIGTLEGIRDTYKGQEGRGRIILGRAIGEAAKTSTYAVIGMILL